MSHLAGLRDYNAIVLRCYVANVLVCTEYKNTFGHTVLYTCVSGSHYAVVNSIVSCER